jgi:hypothetical protein
MVTVQRFENKTGSAMGVSFRSPHRYASIHGTAV